MKYSQTEGTDNLVGQGAELNEVRKSRATKRALRMGALVCSATLFLACGPHGGSWDGNGGGSQDSDDIGVGGAPSAGGGVGVGVGGGVAVCDPQPQQTYVCAGTAYENDAFGAAELLVYPDVCGEQWGTGGWGTGGWNYGGGGGYYYGGEGGYETGGAIAVGGAPSAGGGATVGGAIADPPTEGDTAEKTSPEPSNEPLGFGYGGAPDAGGGPSSDPSKWCNTDPEGTVIGGISFAVGSCQDVDVALPLLLKEPYYGEYTARVYGSSSACDRAVLLSTVAGIGTGQVLEVPFRTEGYSFISVEVQGDRYNEFGIRLRDRPRVVPSPGQ
jgi:hypothetical protein